ILHGDVAAPSERVNQLDPLWVLEVDRQRLLVPIDGQEVRRHPIDEGGPEAARLIATPRLLHLDDLRSEVPEAHRAKRAGEDAGQIQNSNAAQRFHAPRPTP